MRLLSLFLLVISFNLSAQDLPAESHDRLNAAFPNFSFVDPAGQQAKISDYKGEVVLVKLWATWCGLCRKKWPEHQALYNDIKDEQGVRIVTLSIFEDPKVSQSWVDSKKYTVPLYKNLITDKGAVKVSGGGDYFVIGTPMKFLIDKQGVLRKKTVGNNGKITAADIRKLL